MADFQSKVGERAYKISQHLSQSGTKNIRAPKPAETVTALPAQLQPYFAAFASDPATAGQVLNPWMGMPLAQWANRYPLTQDNSHQLAVLFCPQGVYVATVGLIHPEFLQDLTALGVELVKAQG